MIPEFTAARNRSKSHQCRTLIKMEGVAAVLRGHSRHHGVGHQAEMKSRPAVDVSHVRLGKRAWIGPKG